VLYKILAQEDTKVPVGQLLAVIGVEGEDVSSLIGKLSSPSPMTVATSLTSAPPPSAIASRSETIARTESFTRERIDASPLARRMAEEAGSTWPRFRHWSGGRVVKRDIEAFLAQPRSQPSQPPTAPVTAPAAALDASLQVPAQLAPIGIEGVDHTARELSMMRKTIARRMALSKTTALHFYLTTEIEWSAPLPCDNR
jgi:pyruvate dehydrogenase E2 component (dihydrolipoamide acetyltransferase)